MTMSPKIYTITMIQKIDLELINENTKTFLPTFGDKRCVGYYSLLENAKYAVEHNLKNIYDNLYEYCIIEETPEGIYKYSKNIYVYKWNKDHYEPIETPLELSKVCGFGIG